MGSNHMSYQALARQWRPQQFDELIGQAHVVRALTQALAQQRLHHAYLFTGTRGVGKTTLARLLAKCLNCETGVTATPCDQCDSCLAIQRGQAIDVIEVDAASRTKVEDTRELLDNLQYAPTHCRYKIYIIDEVHMLSKHSFNALLKTLEEPPPHVKFLLATTDPQKLPLTVLSRCLHFQLQTVNTSALVEQCTKILTQAKLNFEPEALQHLALAAKGSVRDCLSLLEQAIAYSGSNVNTADIRKLLGIVAYDAIAALLKALATHEGSALLTAIETLANQGADFAGVLTELLHTLHQIAFLQVVPTAFEHHSNRESLLHFSQSFDPETIQLFYQIALQGQKDLHFSPSPQLGFEMTMLRMLAFEPVASRDGPPAATKITAPSSPQHENYGSMTEPSSSQHQRQDSVPKTVNKNCEISSKETSEATKNTTLQWSQLVSQLALTGASLLLANQCELVQVEDQKVVLKLAKPQAALLTDSSQQRLQKALATHFNKTITVNIQVVDSTNHSPAQQQQAAATAKKKQAEQHLANDPKLQQLLQQFDGTLISDSIQLLENE